MDRRNADSSHPPPRRTSPFLQCTIGAHDAYLRRNACREHGRGTPSADDKQHVAIGAPVCCSLDLEASGCSTTLFLDPAIAYGQEACIKLRVEGSDAGGFGVGVAALGAVAGHPKNGVVCGNSRHSIAQGLWFPSYSLSMDTLTSPGPLRVSYHYGSAKRPTGPCAWRLGGATPSSEACTAHRDVNPDLGNSDPEGSLKNDFTGPGGPPPFGSNRTCLDRPTWGEARNFDFFEVHCQLNWSDWTHVSTPQAGQTHSCLVQLVTRLFGGFDSSEPQRPGGDASNAARPAAALDAQHVQKPAAAACCPPAAPAPDRDSSELTPLRSWHDDGAFHVTTSFDEKWLDENPFFHFSVAITARQTVRVLKFDVTSASSVLAALEEVVASEVEEQRLPRELNRLIAEFTARGPLEKIL